MEYYTGKGRNGQDKKKKTCRETQHVKIDMERDASIIICRMVAVGENYNSTRDSRKGNPYDNACIESFHSVLKKEEVYPTTYHTFEETQTALFEYIESFYNRKRRHSALDYKTPQQVEEEALAG